MMDTLILYPSMMAHSGGTVSYSIVHVDDDVPYGTTYERTGIMQQQVLAPNTVGSCCSYMFK